ncbi:ribbon-helix-helix domain-containing protein [Oscillatoria salina]|uniref:ribbon-helix-helix domain-containing protein n=1 Tax=Oscillatoria salina TaxID=331517 RepID=UPI0013BB038A|nr:type II toxin-antitoxin system ParD family antitoxin [Oscillatoria salina]MBZ8181824.1 type II toxin-antitoxin system ParD family antitoxin [Oscillatoria salina IIICB1]NET87044.1 type II toxin-antitoxin system ParD family antitoxin [Kamptonema sp. SIO1D9]
MNISLQPELEQYLQEKVSRGQYQSIDEAIEEGIKLLINRDEIYQGRFEELKEEIGIGVSASEQGDLINSDEVFERLEKKLNQRRMQQENE